MKQIYLDNAATTKIDNEVLNAVNEFQKNTFGNPSSQHSLGRKARQEIENARAKIAKSINALPEEIIFTSGGTEANNFAIKGLCLANPSKRHIITSEIEHPSILEVCQELKKHGYKIDFIKANKDGIIDIEELKKKITKETLLVSIMHINNEIGTIQPIYEIGEICKKKNIYFHTDAIQSFNKIDIDVQSMNINLLSASGHKINAQKGIGFLYIKLGTKIKPILDGGGQEMKLRSGTENTPGIISIAKALDLDKAKEHIRKIRNFIIDELNKIQGTRINGSLENRIYNNINASFYGIEGESLMLMLDKQGIFVSTGSACSSTKLEESHVLKAIKQDELYIHGSIRISLGKDITIEDAKYVIEKIKENVAKLREISPFKLKEDEDE